MTTEQWFEKAIAYFGGDMTTEDTQLFEKETAASEELSQLMQLWKNTDEEATIYEQYNKDAEAFISTHQKLKAEFTGEATGTLSNEADVITLPKKKIKFSTWQWVAVAAGITGIIFMIGFFMRQ